MKQRILSIAKRAKERWVAKRLASQKVRAKPNVMKQLVGDFHSLARRRFAAVWKPEKPLRVGPVEVTSALATVPFSYFLMPLVGVKIRERKITILVPKTADKKSLETIGRVKNNAAAIGLVVEERTLDLKKVADLAVAKFEKKPGRMAKIAAGGIRATSKLSFLAPERQIVISEPKNAPQEQREQFAKLMVSAGSVV